MAEKYRIDQWSICLSTLEYVLTDPEYVVLLFYCKIYCLRSKIIEAVKFLTSFPAQILALEAWMDIEGGDCDLGRSQLRANCTKK